MDSDYYYYYFDDCNLINCTNYLGGNRNGKEII
ncbi:unknown [Clostridium sp. CAG:1000]|nr:unknown [Clostridium sp. CAG:1000]